MVILKLVFCILIVMPVAFIIALLATPFVVLCIKNGLYSEVDDISEKLGENLKVNISKWIED